MEVLHGKNEPSKLHSLDVNFKVKIQNIKSVELINLRGKKNDELSMNNSSFTKPHMSPQGPMFYNLITSMII